MHSNRPPTRTDASDIVFSPQQIAKNTIESVDQRLTQRVGLPTGIKALDKYMYPPRPSNLTIVLGYTSNFKSGLMGTIARNNANAITDPDEVVIYMSWEQSVEEQALVDMARNSGIAPADVYHNRLAETDWKTLKKAAIQRSTVPLWFVGHSEMSNARRPRMTMSDVYLAMAEIIDVHHKKPVAVHLDYLQRINRDDCRSDDARLAYMEIVDRAKDLAVAFHTPVYLGTQSKRDVLFRKWKLPMIADGQETSNLEQSADAFLSVWMPKTTEEPGSTIKVAGMDVVVDDNVLVLGLLKQKFGPAPKIMALHVNPSNNDMYEIASE